MAVVFAASLASTPDPISCKWDEGLGQNFVPKRVLVKPHGDLSVEALRLLLIDRLKTDDLSLKPIGSTGAYAVDSKTVDLPNLPVLGDGFRDDRLDYIQRDPYIIVYGARDPDDPHFGSARDDLWGLVDIAAPAAWLHSTGDKNIVVAVVDSGIDTTHPDLLQQVWVAPVQVGGCPAGSNGYDAIDDRCESIARLDHATEMAGAIGARGNNHIGVVGVNWIVGLLSSGFVDKNRGCASTAVNALKFVRLAKEARAADVRVVNLSWGISYDSWTIRDELQLLSNKGVVLVAAAGNAITPLNIDAKPVYPASYGFDTLIAVAYSMRDGNFGDSSNYGPVSVHIAAPGKDIWTTSYTDPFLYAPEFGTSIATAYVSGSIALLASRCPKLSGTDLKTLLLRNADRRKNFTTYVQDGRFLNVGRAMTECVCRSK
jgi:subtilisin family serine protease